MEVTNDKGLLQIDQLTKAFGGLVAINRVTFQLGRKELSCIIGPNGAGKSTLFNLISGRLLPDKGNIVFNGEDITGRPPHEMCRKGIGRSFQRTSIFKKLTVFENLQLTILCGRGEGFNFHGRMSKMVRDETELLLSEVGLSGQGDRVASTLAYGDQRRIELVMALVNQPQLVLLDEPTAGMSRGETEEAVDLIGRLFRSREMSLIVIEHDMKVVWSIAQRIIVLHQGAVIADGKPEEIRQNETVQRVYLGGGKNEMS